MTARASDFYSINSMTDIAVNLASTENLAFGNQSVSVRKTRTGKYIRLDSRTTCRHRKNASVQSA